MSGSRTSSAIRIAKWNERSAKLKALAQLGKIPVLCAGGLLQGNYQRVDSKTVSLTVILGEPCQPFDLTKVMLLRGYNSVDFNKIRSVGKDDWERLTKAWSGFSQTVSLSLSDQNETATYLGLWDLKQWFLKASIYNRDHGISILKYIQALCLELYFGNTKERAKCPYSDFPGVATDGSPKELFCRFFRGSLSWISDRLVEYYETKEEFLPKLNYFQFQQLFQIAVGKRALPFPSPDQIRKSVGKSLDLCRETRHVSLSVSKGYGFAVKKVASLYVPHKGPEHISCSASSRWESTRGGGGSIAVASSDFQKINQLISIDEALSLEGRVDFLGRQILHNKTAFYLKLQRDYASSPIGKIPIAYLLFEDLSGPLTVDGMNIQLSALCAKHAEGKVPQKLGDILLSLLGSHMTRDGIFIGDEKRLFNLLHFGECPMIVINNALPARISLSVESGLKTRLITAGRYCWSVLVQPARGTSMKTLMSDFSLILGFKELYKTWEFLKRYKGETPKYVSSMDLTDSTYNMPFDILVQHGPFYGHVLGDTPYGRLVRQLCSHRKRRIVSSEDVIKKYDIKEDFETESGSHMGEGLSFIDLTIMNRTVSSIASHYRAYNIEHKTSLKFPERVERVLSFESKDAYSQSAGDDHLAFCQDRAYDFHYRHTMRCIGGVLSPGKCGFSPYAGVFCEHGFIVYTVDEEKRDGIIVPPGCRFGNLVFLDVIKGRLVNGLGKVTGKGDPCFGQATSLNTALQWWNGPRDLARLYFWVQNYGSMRRTQGMNLHLPPIFGGKDLPLHTGERADYNNLSAGKQKYFEYLQAISLLPEKEILYWISLLKSITSQPEKDCIVTLPLLKEKLPLLYEKIETPKDIFGGNGRFTDWRNVEGYCALAGYIPASSVVDELQRALCAQHIVSNTYVPSRTMGVKISAMRKKFDLVWREIKQNVVPVDWPIGQTVSKLAYLMNLKMNSLFIREADVDAVIDRTSMRVKTHM